MCKQLMLYVYACGGPSEWDVRSSNDHPTFDHPTKFHPESTPNKLSCLIIPLNSNIIPNHNDPNFKTAKILSSNMPIFYPQIYTSHLSTVFPILLLLWPSTIFQLPSSVYIRHIFQVFHIRIQFLHRFYRSRPIRSRNGVRRRSANRFLLSFRSIEGLRDRSDGSEQIARID